MLKSEGLYLPSHNPHTNRYTWIVDIALFFQLLLFVFAAFLQSIFFLVVPDATILIGNILITYFPSFVIYLITLVHIYVIMVMYLNIFVMYGYIGYIYVTFAVPFFAKELRLGAKSYMSLYRLREPATLMKEYRAGQLLQNRFNILLGPFLVPLQTLCTIVFVCSSFMVIRHGEDIGTVLLALMCSWSALTLLAWSFILIAAGYLHSKGHQILHSWRCYHGWKFCGNTRKIFMKFRISCKPIMINNGSMFVLRRVSVLNFVKGLVRGLVRALLMLKTN